MPPFFGPNLEGEGIMDWVDVQITESVGPRTPEMQYKSIHTDTAWFRMLAFEDPGRTHRTINLPMSFTKAWKYLSLTSLEGDKQSDHYMKRLQEIHDNYSETSSLSETEFALGWHVPPWTDGTFFETIPDIFTVDLDDIISVEDECKCRRCRPWFESMHRKYAHFFVCARYTENKEDFRFYVSRFLGWNINKGHRRPSRCLYKSGLVICIGRDEPLGVTTTNNRVHVLSRTDETLFTIRSFSRDDPSSINFSPTVGAINTNYTSDEIWHLAKECLRVCRDEHSKCRHRDGSTQTSGFKPTRLIYIGGNDDPPRLVRGESLVPEDSYLALSYCWGGNIEQKTTTLNLQARYRSFLVESQPPTIQDAILVTRKMGFRFLWIDSICNVQDDAADLLNEIAHMEKIYEHADLIISASRAASANDGFLQPILPRDIESTEFNLSIPFKYRYQGDVGRVVLENWHSWPITDSKLEPINTRAWTLQEHLLSKRILSFHTTGLSWQCLSDSKFGSWKNSYYTDKAQVLSAPSNMVCRNVTLALDENGRNLAHRSFPSEVDPAMSRSLFPFESVRQEWDGLLNNFLERRLTKPNDRLPAFSAIPKQFAYAFGPAEDYIAGHWRRHLPVDLLWYHEKLIRDQLDTFPTWSWASCGYAGMARFESSGLNIPFSGDSEEAKMKISEIDLSLVNPSDPFGNVHHARLLVSAAVVGVKLDIRGLTDEHGKHVNEIEGAEYDVPDDLWHFSGDEKPRFNGRLDGRYRSVRHVRLANLLGKLYTANLLGRLYLAEVLRGGDGINKATSNSRGLIIRRSGPRDERGRMRFERVGTYEMSYGNDREHDEFTGSDDTEWVDDEEGVYQEEGSDDENARDGKGENDDENKQWGEDYEDALAKGSAGVSDRASDGDSDVGSDMSQVNGLLHKHEKEEDQEVDNGLWYHKDALIEDSDIESDERSDGGNRFRYPFSGVKRRRFWLI